MPTETSRAQIRRWRKAARERGAAVIAWMRTQQGPVRLSDDDAAALAYYAHSLEHGEPSPWLLLLLLLGED